MTSLEILSAVFRPTPVTPRPKYVGVYLLIRKDEIVYVGQSIDVESRVASHRVNTRNPVLKPKRPRFDRSMWISVPVEDLNDFEGALIRAFRPRYNFSAPSHRGRDNEILRTIGLDEHADEDLNAAEFARDRSDAIARRPNRRSDREFNRSIRKARERTAQSARAKRLWSAVEGLLRERVAS